MGRLHELNSLEPKRSKDCQKRRLSHYTAGSDDDLLCSNRTPRKRARPNADGLSEACRTRAEFPLPRQWVAIPGSPSLLQGRVGINIWLEGERIVDGDGVCRSSVPVSHITSPSQCHCTGQLNYVSVESGR